MKPILSSLFAVFIAVMMLTAPSGILYAVELNKNGKSEMTSGFEFDSDDPYRSEFFQVRDTPNITVNTISGNIEIFRNPDLNGVQVDLYVSRSFSLWAGTRSLDDFRIILNQHGNRIVASVEERRPGRRARGGDIQFHFVVQVPEKASTNLKTVNGNIELHDIDGNHYLQNQIGDLFVSHVNGDIRVQSTDGSIELSDINGSTFARTVRGDILAYQNSGEIRVRTISGNIVSERTSGTLISATINGSISAEFEDVSQGVFMETVNGDINLGIPARHGYNIKSEGMNFDFSGVDQGLISELNQSSSKSTLVVGEGGLPVQLKTISGLIRVSTIE